MRSIETVVAQEAVRFVRKDHTKLKLTLGLYALSAKDRELGKVARASYFFIRHLDDLLDGEMDIGCDPLEYTDELISQVQSGYAKKQHKIAKLANFAIPILEERGRPEDSPRQDFLNVIDALIFDYHRRLERRVLSQSELRGYYSAVLDPGLNLMLIGFRSGVRAVDMPEFSPNIGRLYSVRDLEKDWELGFINVPSETMTSTDLDQFSDVADVISHPEISRWVCNELIVSSKGLSTAKQGLDLSGEPLTDRVTDGFISQAIKAAQISSHVM